MFVITIMIVRHTSSPSPIQSCMFFMVIHMLTHLIHRPNRQRLRALQIRRQRATGQRRAQQPLVRRPAHLLRAEPRDRLPRSLLSPTYRRGLRARRVLQLHTPQGAQSGHGSRHRAVHEKVAAYARSGSEESEQVAFAGADAAEVLGWMGICWRVDLGAPCGGPAHWSAHVVAESGSRDTAGHCAYHSRAARLCQ